MKQLFYIYPAGSKDDQNMPTWAGMPATNSEYADLGGDACDKLRICRPGRGCLRQTQNMPTWAGMPATNSEYAGLGGDACDKPQLYALR